MLERQDSYVQFSLLFLQLCNFLLELGDFVLDLVYLHFFLLELIVENTQFNVVAGESGCDLLELVFASL